MIFLMKIGNISYITLWETEIREADWNQCMCFNSPINLRLWSVKNLPIRAIIIGSKTLHLILSCIMWCNKVWQNEIHLTGVVIRQTFLCFIKMECVPFVNMTSNYILKTTPQSNISAVQNSGTLQLKKFLFVMDNFQFHHFVRTIGTKSKVQHYNFIVQEELE